MRPDESRINYIPNEARPVANAQEVKVDAATSTGAGDSVASEQDQDPGSAPAIQDYPLPEVLRGTEPFLWDTSRLTTELFRAFGERLAKAGDLFRLPGYGCGLLLASNLAHVEPVRILSGRHLAAVVFDRVPVRIVSNGKIIGDVLNQSDLSLMLQSEIFLREFLPVDEVLRTARYLPDFRLTRPGLNDGGVGQRLLFVGDEPATASTTEAITKFLDVMAFATNADRTNAVAAALTVLLRNHWLGAKPVLVVTSTKSHGGKDTIIHFATGTSIGTSISFQAKDWALQREFVGALKHNPETAVVTVENARLDGKVKVIAAAFLERFATDPYPFLFATGTGSPVRRSNTIVIAISTNFGSVSTDLLNRALPIHLNPQGDIASRRSPIGNPKLEYLPANREKIEAELHGMIARWIAAGRPLDTDVKHPFSDWARTIGGILRVNGFTDFLANYGQRITQDDPVREALGRIGAAKPDQWLRAGEWARLTLELGFSHVLFIDAETRTNEKARERVMGCLLMAHRNETFAAETEDARISTVLRKARRRFAQGHEPENRYRFEGQSREAIPEDPPSGEGGSTT
jgi:hypothetical protein